MTSQFPEPRTVNAGGVRLAIYEADGDRSGQRPPVILVHGWPEISYSWKNQISALADAGWRVIAIDLKGFGASDAPGDKSLYDIEHLTNDLAALLDALKFEKAIFCGHDWGGAIVWAMGQLRPERVAGIIGVCTPLRKRPPAPPIGILKKRFTEKHYFVQFQKPDFAETLFETDVEKFFRLVFQKPAPRERWVELVPAVFDLPGRFQHGKIPGKDDLVISEKDLSEYVKAYSKSGFRGGVNIYRNVDRNWEIMEGRDEIVRAPSLWIGAELDLFLPPEAAIDLDDLVPDLEKHVIKDCGHWVTWEKPQELNALMSSWLERRFVS